MLPGALPEKTRNEAARQMLRTPGADWLLQIDADMTWSPDAIVRLLQTAYGDLPHADVVGAYCPLRGELALPTIDTGTGTWESWFPGSGTVEVIRTGAAFHLVKRRVYEALKDPWYRLRVPARPVDFMAEVDNFARMKYDGKNPFRELPNREWERLEQCALEDPSTIEFTPAEVGEDSGFMDRVRNAGFRIFVNTDIVIGHVDTKVTTWQQHKEAIEKNERQNRLIAGLLD
jgi:glycosyltransferase involved in cell wall biosynthesis